MVLPSQTCEGAYRDPDFNTVGNPFEVWVGRNRPSDKAGIGFGNWESLDEAKANGLLTAQLSAEWADHLKANNCGYRDFC